MVAPVYHPQKRLCLEVPDGIKVGEKFVMAMRVTIIPELASYSTVICSDSLLSLDTQVVVSRLEEKQKWNFGDEVLWGLSGAALRLSMLL